MNKYDLVIFDLDGTMLDTSEGVMSSIKYAINEMNYEMPDEETLRSFIGPPVGDSFARVYGISGNDLDKMSNLFRDHYKNIDLLKAYPYEGIFEAFSYLRENNIKSAVATYKRQDYTNMILSHFGFDKYTDIIYGSDFEGKLKKMDIILKCIEVSGITDKSKAVMIGDTLHDALGANQLGVDFIGVTYGFGFFSKEDVEQYNNVGYVDNIADLKNLI